jgi:arylsulfatase A-like enzyme
MRHTLATTVAATALAALPAWAQEAAKPAAARPNIVYILCDDLGWGDVQCNNPQGKIPTPNIDKLAAQGMRFTDAHSGSAVCTPTRYGILTGRYSWRTHLQARVLLGYDKPLIAADRLTVPALLKQQGYATACIGKWHLGAEIPKDPTVLEVKEGPTTRGFDYYFGIAASLDMPPFAYIENDHFTQAPTATKKWLRAGTAALDFETVDVLPTLTRKAVEHLDRQTPAKPFFLYLPLNSPHAPIVPTREWQGKSGIGNYGDFVMETDWAVGQVLAAIEKRGLAENTLVIFTSDNGCAPAANPANLEKQGHFPSAGYRGYKTDIWEGGHRVPFIVRWPGQVKAGAVTDQVVCLTDLMATCAEITGAKLPDNAGEDSISLLPVLKRTAQGPVRDSVVHHSSEGMFSIRQGTWKLETCAGSGGRSKMPGKELPPVQLYDLAQDPSEKHNVQAEQPEVVAKLTTLLEKQVADGRSTPGAAQKNDVAIKIIKDQAKPKK